MPIAAETARPEADPLSRSGSCALDSQSSYAMSSGTVRRASASASPLRIAAFTAASGTQLVDIYAFLTQVYTLSALTNIGMASNEGMEKVVGAAGLEPATLSFEG
jgi:hypothetical protein